MVLPIKSCYMGIILLATCAVLAHCVLESSMPTDQFADNPEDKNEDTIAVPNKRPSFFVGSRYGRSNGGAGGSSSLFSPSKIRRLNVVPRNDRFFLGSRYGKRASDLAYLSPYEQNAMESTLNAAAAAHWGNSKPAILDGNGSAMHMMTCTYTGVSNYYRCSSIDGGLNNIINQLTASHSVVDDDSERE